MSGHASTSAGAELAGLGAEGAHGLHVFVAARDRRGGTFVARKKAFFLDLTKHLNLLKAPKSRSLILARDLSGVYAQANAATGNEIEFTGNADFP